MLAVRPDLADLGWRVEIIEVGTVRNQQKFHYLRGAEITRYMNS
jgi:hypothetical protein